MNWVVISGIATVIGVAGGLISLVFLVIGVRRNTQALEGSTVQSLMIFEKDVYALLIANADCFVRGCADVDALSAENRFKFSRLVNAQMSLFYSAYVQHKQKLMGEDVWQAYWNAMCEDLATPGFWACWTSMESNYPESFGALVRKR